MRANPILAYSLYMGYLTRVSKVEAKQIVESFFILTRVSKLVCVKYSEGLTIVSSRLRNRK